MARQLDRQFVLPITTHPPPPSVGTKAYNLYRLLQVPVRVPTTYAVIWDAYEAYLRDEVSLVDLLRAQLQTIVDPNKAYAVRSSADVEDTLEHSCAGQFNTLLGVEGEEAVMSAIWAVWATAGDAGVRAYLARHAAQQGALRMGVIVQEMVPPHISGVAFSRNPITGADEVIVEAVEGAGTALVQQGVTPFRWVKREGQWHTGTDHAPVSLDLIGEVVEETRRIAAACGDVDLEWVYDGHKLYWVQMRAISTPEEPTVYSNRIAREVLPGLIKPLVWSINIPLVNDVWVALLTELIGENDLRVDDLARSFYYRTYFNLTALGRIWEALGMPRESLEIVMGVIPRPENERMFRPGWRMIRLTPRLLRFMWKKWRLGARFEADFPRLEELLAGFDWREAPALGEAELLARVEALFAALRRPVYYNITVPLLMSIYDTLFGRVLARAGVDAAHFHLLEGMSALRDYAPDHFLDDLRRDVAGRDPALRGQLHTCTYAEFQALPGLTDLQQRVDGFLEQFGHLSDSGNDFSAVPWRENPELILRLIAQDATVAAPPAAKTRFADLPLRGLRRRWAAALYRRARSFRLYREQISSLYTYGYGLFRPYFRALGARFVARGVLAEVDDIFYLTREEVERVVAERAEGVEGPAGYDFAALAARRRAELERSREMELPTLIHGHAEPVVDASVEKRSGVATSRGTYTGPVRRVRSLADFHLLQPGDVLVIPYSDVGWTPLFARAGAVIAESGGMLSHSSIVAREYQIPAVVSVSGAMNLPDEVLVTVDGYRGEILVHERVVAGANAESPGT